MRNEAAAFSFQPNNKVEIPTPNQSTEKKSAVVLQFPKKENVEKQVRPYDNIRQEICQTEETYLERRKRRYSSLDDSKKVVTPLTEEMIKTRKYIAEDIIDILPNNKNNTGFEIKSEDDLAHLISEISTCGEGAFEVNKSVLQWIEKNGKEGFLAAERIVTEQIKTEKAVSFKMLALLGEIWQSSCCARFPSEELIEALEFSEGNPLELQNRLAMLNELNNPTTNVAFHKILDFLKGYTIGCQNDLEEKYINSNSQFFQTVEFLEDEIKNSKNYLVASHLKDIIETLRIDTIEKEGMLHGVSGGASDETIYTYKHLNESYENRFRYGINEGYSVANPMIQVAPGYIGFYANERINGIYSQEKSAHDPNFRMQEFASKNDARDDFFYDQINEPLNISARNYHPSNGLQKLETIWDFEKNLKRKGRKFFYDLSRVDTQDLHPFVVSEMMTRNSEYLHEVIGTENESVEVSEDEYLNRLFLTGKISEEQLYNYLYFTKLDVRKKVEDDFGIDIGELNFATQRYFLNFLETRSIENVSQLQQFACEFGVAGIQTFLSCEYGLETGEKIIEIGKSLSLEATNAIFSKYGEMVENVGELDLLLEKYFKKNENVTQQDRFRVADAILLKGKDFLMHFSDRLLSGEEIETEVVIEELERIKSEVALFVSIFKTFAKNNPDISFEDFKGITFETGSGVEMNKNKEDSTRMIAVAEKNYLENESLKKLVVESLEEGLQKENSQFYILRHNGEIVAFCRFDNEGDHFYAGSFNVDPDYRGSAIGEVMMKESLDKKAQEKPVHAITNPEKKICSKYVEDEGFIIGGILYTEFEGKTLEEVDIIRDDENNKKYAYRQNGITRENLLDIYQDQKSNKRSDIIKSKNPFIVQFTKDETSRFLNVADKLCKEYGYVITRYLPVDKNEERMFATFEQKL